MYTWFVRSHPKEKAINLKGIDDEIYLLISNSDKYRDVIEIKLYLKGRLIDAAAFNTTGLFVLIKFNKTYRNVIESKMIEMYEDSKDVFPELKNVSEKENADEFFNLINKEDS